MSNLTMISIATHSYKENRRIINRPAFILALSLAFLYIPLHKLYCCCDTIYDHGIMFPEVLTTVGL